jgi:uncharacterized protein YaeQ
MALTATLYRFTIHVSDVDRGLYETLELRPARHPSESVPFLLTRVIAYCLNVQEGLEFTRGICMPDEPALWVRDLTGALKLWIDIGNPSAERLHKAAKASAGVRIYTHRDPKILQDEVKGQPIHRRERVEVFALSPKFLEKLGETLERDNEWQLLFDEGELSISVDDVSVQGEITRHSLE